MWANIFQINEKDGEYVLLVLNEGTQKRKYWLESHLWMIESQKISNFFDRCLNSYNSFKYILQVYKTEGLN